MPNKRINDVSQAELMIVDDKVENLTLLTEMFKSEGYIVRPSNSGELALLSIAKKLPDIILLDVKMPTIDGFEMCARLKANDKTKDIPIIFITALDEAEERIKAFNLGAVDFITKPFNKQEVILRVRTHLNFRIQQLKLMESEEKFRYLFENSAVGKSVTLPTGEIEFNQTMCRMLGYSAEELRFKRFQDLKHPDDIEFSEREIREVILGRKESMRFNKRYIKKDGSILWADVLSVVRRNEDGTPAYFMTSIVDITEKIEAQESLKQSENMYRTFIDASSDMVFLKDEQFRYIVANQKLTGFLNSTSEHIIGKTDYELMPEKVANNCRLSDANTISSKTSVISEEQFGEQTYETTKFPVQLRDNKNGVGGFIRDITERKQKETRIFQLNRLYATLSQINQTIVRVNDQESLLKTVCEMTIEFGKYRMAWIGLANHIDGTVTPITFSGEEQGYLSKINIDFRDEELGRGPTGTAIREERCIICQNIATDPKMLAWREQALLRGYMSSAAIPISKNGKIFYVLSVYSSEVNGFDSEDEGLLLEIGGDISFALDKLENEENRQRIVAALEESEQRNRSYIENAPDGVVIIDEFGNFAEVNRAAVEMIGYTKDELIKMNIIGLLTDESISGGTSLLKELVETGSGKGTLQFKNHEGSYRWMSIDAVKLNGHDFLAFTKDISDRIKTEEELRENEEKYRLLYTSMSQGLALHEIITDDNGKPIDYVYLDINESYMRLLNVTREMCIGKRVTEVMSEVEQYWIDVFGKVALTGEPCYYENYFDVTGRYYATYTYSPKKRQFAVLVTDITERKNDEKKLMHLSYHDQLTGLYNRRFFEEELKRLDTKRNLPISLIMADINGLKIINDSFGHTTGDDYLIKLAEILKSACRADEIISRLGGDEFVVILPKTDSEEASRIVKRLKDVISNTSIGNFELSVSFGYDTKTKEDQPISEVLASSENHMYTHKIAERKSIRSKTVEMIMGTLFEKSGREAQHSQRVSEICKEIAIKLNLDKDDVEQVRIAGLVHDIGKIGISETILNKAGNLENDERAVISRHPEAGWRILNTTTEFSEVAVIVQHHHEKFDGSGYPNGIKGEQIPLPARIVAIADAYDAMTSERSYRNAISHEDAIAEIVRCSGTHFDPAIVEAFVR